jgi:predicted nucleotidyltransferase component of viral defense system
MSIRIIQQRLTDYHCQSALEEDQALREITQEIVLAALSRSGIFAYAGFHGGTCLRIFHALNRFSEDLDFALLEPDPAFSLDAHLRRVVEELAAFGYRIEIDSRGNSDRTVQAAFLKDDSIGRLLRLDFRPGAGPARKLRIKLEVDTRPPAGATYAMPLLDFPFPSPLRVFDLPSLLAGKLHAVLCRSHLKGRDWYDFLWYAARRVPVNHALLSASLDQAGPWAGHGLRSDDAWCAGQLQQKIAALDWHQAREDVRRFVKPAELASLDYWSAAFFLAQCAKLLPQDPVSPD